MKFHRIGPRTCRFFFHYSAIEQSPPTSSLVQDLAPACQSKVTSPPATSNSSTRQVASPKRHQSPCHFIGISEKVAQQCDLSDNEIAPQCDLSDDEVVAKCDLSDEQLTLTDYAAVQVGCKAPQSDSKVEIAEHCNLKGENAILCDLSSKCSALLPSGSGLQRIR